MARESIEVERMRGAKAAFDTALAQQGFSQGAFRTAAEAAPFALRSLGLGAGISTLAAKEGEGRRLAALVSTWLLLDTGSNGRVWNALAPLHDDQRQKRAISQFLDHITISSRGEYRNLQVEAIAFASWVKRLAQAFCEKEGA